MSFKISVEYIQDFINCFGIKMYIEEFDRLINCYIEMEIVSYITGKMTFEELSYEEDIPMPNAKTIAEFNSVNFMGRLLKQIKLLTDPKRA